MVYSRLFPIFIQIYRELPPAAVNIFIIRNSVKYANCFRVTAVEVYRKKIILLYSLKSEMGGAYGAYGGEESYLQGFSGETWW
jgi:hypothetical protein